MSFLYLENTRHLAFDGMAHLRLNYVILGSFARSDHSIFMVRRGTLKTYRYVEHGAFYRNNF